MDIKKFSKETIKIITPIHIAFIRLQPNVLTKGKISFPQMVIMEILRLKRTCKMSDVSYALGVTKSAVTGLTDRLIKAGFIQRSRSTHDRRIVNITFTPKGANLARKLYKSKLKTIESLFSGLSSSERSHYLSILKKINRNLSTKKATHA